MKKFIVLPMIALLAIPAFAGSTKTTTTRTYDSSTSAPVAAPVMDSEMNSEMIEAEEEQYGETLDHDAIEQERMEERLDQQRMEESRMNESTVTDDDIIDYSDRTRTNRERKALNTGSDASDDQ